MEEFSDVKAQVVLRRLLYQNCGGVNFRYHQHLAALGSPKNIIIRKIAKEMRNLNVSGEHIDAFCGRLPSSVRGKHYTDFSKKRLREVYEKADIEILVLSQD